jgi:hypothetical protein
MQHLEVSCAVRPIYGLLGAKGLNVSSLLGQRNSRIVQLLIVFLVVYVASCVLSVFGK